MGARSIKIAAVGATVALFAGATPGQAAVGSRYRARMAVRYLVENQMNDGSVPGFSAVGSTADSILAFVAAKRGPGAMDDALNYLAEHEQDIDDVGEKAKVVLALVAAGAEPRDWEKRDLVAEIENAEVNGHYGQLPASLVFDQALAILALRAAGDTVPDRVIDWLVDAQCGNGGWQFDQPSSPDDNKRCYNAGASTTDYNVADTNTTSYVIQSLVANGGEEISLPGRPWSFLKKARDPIKRGWVFAPQFACGRNQEPPECSASDTNSTSLVIQAYTARNKALPAGARKALRGLQRRLCGGNAGGFAVSWIDDDGKLVKGPPDVGATVGAVLGLLEEPLPLRATSDLEPAPDARKC